jgi:DNA-binding beta-propeller fold protein YncE
VLFESASDPDAKGASAVIRKVATIADPGSVTIINGVTNSTVTDPKALPPSAVAVNPVTNKIYVAKKFSHTSHFQCFQ